MKKEDFIILLLLATIHFYPNLIIEVSNSILGKLIFICIIIIIGMYDTIHCVLFILIVIILHNKSHIESFNNIAPKRIVKKKHIRTREPFVTSSNERMGMENILRANR